MSEQGRDDLISPLPELEAWRIAWCLLRLATIALKAAGVPAWVVDRIADDMKSIFREGKEITQ